ncbi:MAG: sodium/proline symporter [Planctomycetes bacterium]|nr:sodium/proline symporter [Planctomycetota bacterium]
MTDRELIVTIVCVYLIVCVVIGIWASKRTKNAKDFFIAGKGIGVWLLGIAAFSTTMSGFGFIGGPGLVYKFGTSSLWICVPAALGFAISWLLVSKRLRVFAELFDVLTLPDAIEARYGSRACRLLASIVILLGVVGYLGTNILAFGMVAQTFFEIDFTLSVLIGMAVIIFYAVAGGIIASLYTDVFQGAIMIFASIGLFIVAMTTAGEGNFADAPAKITDAILATPTPEAVGPWGLVGPMLCLSWFFVFVLGGTGQPHVITKNFMIKKLSGLRFGLPIAALAYMLCALLWVGVGFAMKYLVVTGKASPLAEADHAAPVFLMNHTPAWLAGIVFAGVFAAIMSTADSFLNLGAAVFVHDIPKAIHGKPARRELLMARTATFVLAIAATLFALTARENLVAMLGIFSWGTFAAAFVPAVAIGFSWKRATWQAAAAAMGAGLALNIGLEAAKRIVGNDDKPLFALPYGVDIGAVSLMGSIIIFVLVSLVTKPPVISKRLETAIEI